MKDQCSRIQLIDKATLVDPDPQGILAEPLGNLKTDLTRRSENLEKDVIKLNQSLESIHQRLSTEQDSEKSFLKMIQQTHLSEDDLPKLLAKVQSMETQFRGYDVWIQISISFVDILSQLDQLPSEGDPLRSPIQQYNAR